MTDETTPNQDADLNQNLQGGDTTPAGDGEGGDSNESEIITINRKDLFNELGRLQKDDQEFRQALGTIAGRHNKSQYESQLQEARLENQRLQREFRKLELGKLSPEELKNKLADDSDFRKEYDELQSSDEVHQQQVDLLRMNRSVESIFTTAEDAGIPEETIAKYKSALKSGKYDFKDSSGQPTMDWPDALQYLQRDLMLEKSGISSQRAKDDNSDAKNSDDASKPNENLRKRNPDMSAGKGAAGKSLHAGLTVEKLQKMSQDEVDAIPWETIQRVMASA